MRKAARSGKPTRRLRPFRRLRRAARRWQWRIISRLGLALEEPPHTNPGMSFENGDIYSVRVGLTNGTDEHAIVSAMVRVRESGTDMLWTA